MFFERIASEAANNDRLALSDLSSDEAIEDDLAPVAAAMEDLAPVAAPAPGAPVAAATPEPKPPAVWRARPREPPAATAAEPPAAAAPEAPVAAAAPEPKPLTEPPAVWRARPREPPAAAAPEPPAAAATEPPVAAAAPEHKLLTEPPAAAAPEPPAAAAPEPPVAAELEAPLARPAGKKLALFRGRVDLATGVAKGEWVLPGDADYRDADRISKFTYRLTALSGKWEGSFELKPDEEDVQTIADAMDLVATKNAAGGHNLRGTGRNAFAAYAMAGTVDAAGALDLARLAVAAPKPPKRPRVKAPAARVDRPGPTGPCAAAAQRSAARATERSQLDSVLALRDAALSRAREAERARDAAWADRDAAVAERDAAIRQRDAAIAQRDAAVAERDASAVARIEDAFALPAFPPAPPATLGAAPAAPPLGPAAPAAEGGAKRKHWCLGGDDDEIATRVKAMMQDDPNPREGTFGTREFRDSSKSQYNHALKHFIPFARRSARDLEVLMTFVAEDGRICDEIFVEFAEHCNAQDDMTQSVFANCVKWMQKNLVWQCERRAARVPREARSPRTRAPVAPPPGTRPRETPPPRPPRRKQLPAPKKGYVGKVPAVKAIAARLKEMQAERKATSEARDAALLAKLSPSQRAAPDTLGSSACFPMAPLAGGPRAAPPAAPRYAALGAPYAAAPPAAPRYASLGAPWPTPPAAPRYAAPGAPRQAPSPP